MPFFPTPARFPSGSFRLTIFFALLLVMGQALANLEPLTDVAQLATRDAHACVVTASGGVRCWGSNSHGQLGDGTTQARLTAVEVVGLGSGVQAVRTGRGHSCALTVAGAVLCWGRNDFGQLGDGSTSQRSTPTPVSGLSSGVQEITLGDAHSCAIPSNGAAVCWGHNFLGQLGNSSDIDQSVPGLVFGMTSGVQAISAGHHHTCAIASGSGARCWGYNQGGQLGDGTSMTRFSPVDVVGLGSGVLAIQAGVLHTCALISGGAMKCWGNNFEGQLGDGSTTNRLTPEQVLGLETGVTSLGAGHYHSCALMAVGELRCWGSNFYGQLGVGIEVSGRLTPTTVTGLDGQVDSIAIGRQHACAVLTKGRARCWGNNDYGQLGTGQTSLPRVRLVPVSVSGLDSGVHALVAGSDHTCARTAAGAVRCWGSNAHGQLGNGETTRHFLPINVSGLPASIQALAAGGRHSCALAGGGDVHCWGNNQFGQLGHAGDPGPHLPLPVEGLAGPTAAIANGLANSCAVNTSGRVSCWGAPSLGLGAQPMTLADLVSGMQAVSVGTDHGCVRTTTGGVSCWGNNTHGQFGFFGDSSSFATQTVPGMQSGVESISAGFNHNCAVSAGGRVECWGSNTYGQGGSPAPVTISGMLSGMQAVSAGAVHNCALSNGGEVRCWGSNQFGQLGNGTTTNSWMPVQVTGLASGVQAITAGERHACALTNAGGVLCWGDNALGQMGDGTLPGVPFPQMVMQSPSLFRDRFEESVVH
jgi:alpha-tubulin suppressor-like RCC1 family protein